MVEEHIFREYDIRGIAGRELNPEIAEMIGSAFGTYLRERGTKDVIVGHDSRASSHEYKEAVIKGLIKTGCNVFDIGLTLSSILYFARQHYNIGGAVMITASHNPPEYNGFKLCHGLNAITGEEIQKVKNILLQKNFKKGKGKIRKLEPAHEYFNAIKERTRLEKSLKVVVDCGNATPAIFIPSFLENLGCKVIPLFCDIDPRFPNHIPNPAHLKNYKELVEKVKEEGADLGLMFDGDGDRVGFVDEKGNILLGDTILTILVRELLPERPGAKVIVELKNSEIVVEETKRLGGIPIFWKTGHALLDKKVYEEKALLCGEMSCHYWITDNWYYFDDAIYAMAKVLEIASRKNLHKLASELPKYESSPEYRIYCPEEIKFKIVKELVDYFKERHNKYIDLDGIRCYVHDGWFLIRASNTEPAIVVRCEAKSKDGLKRIKEMIEDKLDEYGLKIE